jgi:hypothetical protein
MKRSSRSVRTPVNLSESVQHHLNQYALLAGVGVLAFANPVEAKIVYTPANIRISPNTAFPT